MPVFHFEQSKLCPCLSGAFFDTKCSHQRAHFISKHSEAALTALQSIHQIHILHEDIRHENILMGDRGITIVDFGHSRQSNNKIAKKQEYQELCRLLKLA